MDLETLKELQAKEVDMLEQVINALKKMGLKYYVVYGTLIGAVRHKGFIPWDDDVDICMPREDYDTFLDKGQQYLPENLFIQTAKSDKEYTTFFSKVRNSNTTFVENSVKNKNINHGIYIDIFPLDNRYESETRHKIFVLRQKFYSLIAARNDNVDGFTMAGIPMKYLVNLLRIVPCSSKKAILKIDKMAKKCNNKPSKYCAVHLGNLNKEKFDKSIFGEGVELPFDRLMVNAPEKYHEHLTAIYGDYMKLPPKEEQVNKHIVAVADMTKSYVEYVGKDSY